MKYLERRKRMSSRIHWILAVPVLAAGPLAAEEGSAKSSYSPVVITETFEAVMARMKAAKAEIQKKQKDLLEARYDLSDKGSRTTKMTRGKPVQEGVRVKLPSGVTWDQLGAMKPEE